MLYTHTLSRAPAKPPPRNYAPQPDGVWFPVSFGTEFKLHVLFFFSRQIIIDALNRNFEKTHVTSEMVRVGEPVNPQ